MPITKRETTKEVRVYEQNYKIKKMDARLATFIAFQVKSMIPTASSAEDAAGRAQGSMDRRAFFALQNDCLSVCFHVMEAGEIAVLDEKGNFTNADLSMDPKTVALLVVHSLAFNVTDFFDELFLKEFTGAIVDMMPHVVKTSTSS